MSTRRPAQDVWWVGMCWVEAAQMQADRFEEAFYAWQRALLDAEMRASLKADTDHAKSWRDSYDAHTPYDPHRPIHVPSHALRMQVSSEASFLLVAARNVMRAQDRLPVNARTSMGDQGAIKALRNVLEHYDEADGGSSRTLAADFPSLETEAFAYTNKEIWFGGLSGVPLSRVRAWLHRVRVALVAALEAAGVEVPHDLLASAVEGDDELPWPPERIHYGYWIPHVEEPEWPRRDAPEGVAELMAERFRRLRARDSMD